MIDPDRTGRLKRCAMFAAFCAAVAFAGGLPYENNDFWNTTGYVAPATNEKASDAQGFSSEWWTENQDAPVSLFDSWWFTEKESNVNAMMFKSYPRALSIHFK